MSLIQVLVTLVITMVTGMFALQMVLQMKKVEILMNLQSEVNEVERHSQRVLVDPIACLDTITPVLNSHDSDFPLTLPSINMPHTPGPPVVQNILYSAAAGTTPGSMLANQQLQLQSIRLVREKPSPVPTPLAPFPKSGVVGIFIELRFKKMANEIGGDMINRWVPLSIHTDQTGGMTQCSAVDPKDLTQLACTNLGLTPDPTTGLCPLENNPKVIKTACAALGLHDNGTVCTP
jgi:hypothetical protein